jgi:hypothetical protein
VSGIDTAGGAGRSWPGPLSAAVAVLCQWLGSQVGERTAVGLRDVLRRLASPLQVAVAGRISSGKSTLVNALIGRRVAPTDVGECTRLVTRFSYGTVDRVEVVLRDGARQALPFDAGGTIPAGLGVEPGTVSHLEAYLTSAVLRDLTVIDTPGLGSLDTASAARAESLLGTAGGELDDISQAVRADDAQVLAAFTAATASRDAGPVNAIAVLNKADTIPPESVEGADGDVWKAASALAARQAATLKPRVADVLPVIGLLAETAETGGFTATDADALKALAGTDQTIRDAMLLSADLFTTLDAPVPEGTRRRLLEHLDLYGVGCALTAIDADPAITVGALRRTLLDASGLAGVRGRLDAVFRARADAIKAAAALASVTALARAGGDPGERQRMRDAIEVLLQRPEAHQLRLLEALTLVTSGAVAMPEDLVDEVVRVGGSSAAGEQLGMVGHGRGELAGYALERAGWWRSFAAFGATPAQSRVAHVVHRAYFLIWQSLRED